MISSRWPRPIGIIASMALMPVCTGVLTGERRTTRGAMTSTGRAGMLAGSGPLPSIGSPSGFTTRPISSGPTGTEAIRPVRRTSSPSSMSVYGPTTMTPTDSSSRFRAMPMTFCLVNSTSSSAPTLPRPYTRAMPSPTWTTEPTSRVSTAEEKFAICSTRMELISSVGAAILEYLCQLPREGLPQAVDPPTHTIVDDLVANSRDDPANDRRIDARLDTHLVGIAPKVRRQALRDHALKLRIQRNRRGDVGGDDRSEEHTSELQSHSFISYA